MPLFKDLASCGIRFLRFSFHWPGGLEPIDAFWESQGLDRAQERLVFGKYVRNQRTHTVFVEWVRSHAACADVRLVLHSQKPEGLFPRRGKKHLLLTQDSFAKFFNIVRTVEIPWGIETEYAYPTRPYLGTSRRLDKSVRMTRVSFEAFNDDGDPLTYLDHFHTKGEWLTIIKPARPVQFLKEPVSDKFFDAPYNMACGLAESLGRHEE